MFYPTNATGGAGGRVCAHRGKAPIISVAAMTSGSTSAPNPQNRFVKGPNFLCKERYGVSAAAMGAKQASGFSGITYASSPPPPHVLARRSPLFTALTTRQSSRRPRRRRGRVSSPWRRPIRRASFDRCCWRRGPRRPWSLWMTELRRLTPPPPTTTSPPLSRPPWLAGGGPPARSSRSACARS